MEYNTIKRDIFYTSTQEWIEFNNNDAIVGIANGRLVDVKEIRKIDFFRVYGEKKKGDILARIQLDRKVIEVHMPVDGKIVCLNNIDRLIQQKLLFKYPETTGWLVKIRLSKPCMRKGLMDSETV